MTARAVNSVEVDEAAELAELEGFAQAAATAERELEAAEAAAAIEAEGHDPAAWRRASDFVVLAFTGRICPNWNLTAEDHEQLSSALAEVMDHYFPGGPHGIDNWHPLLKLGAAIGGVAVVRGVDWSAGRLIPLRPPEDLESANDGDGEAAERVAPVPGGDDAERQVGGRFEVGG